MAEKYLIDTSAVIKYLNSNFSEEDAITWLDEIIDSESLISFITEIELLAWEPENDEDLAVYQQFIQSSYVFGIDSKIITEAIRIRKNYRIKLPDALIAATALAHNLTLIADNDKDFNKVPDIKYFNPNSNR